MENWSCSFDTFGILVASISVCNICVCFWKSLQGLAMILTFTRIPSEDVGYTGNPCEYVGLCWCCFVGVLLECVVLLLLICMFLGRIRGSRGRPPRRDAA